MPATDLFAGQATLARSVRLLGEFRFEQSDPARFYGALADDTVALVTSLWTSLHGVGPRGCTVLDVGGGPGYFATAFTDAGLEYVGVEPDASEDACRACRGSGVAAASSGRRAWPCRSPTTASTSACPPTSPNTFPIRGAWAARCCGSPGPVDWSCCRTPCGSARSVAHEMGLTHYLGGGRAAERYTRKHGRRPKNDYGSSLFAVSVADGLDWAESTGMLVAAFPRYHPRWAWWMTRTPLLREFLVSNLVLVLRPS